jgi:hypothetical protein
MGVNKGVYRLPVGCSSQSYTSNQAPAGHNACQTKVLSADGLLSQWNFASAFVSLAGRWFEWAFKKDPVRPAEHAVGCQPHLFKRLMHNQNLFH